MNSLFNQSRSFFYRKIINKYRKGRRNSFIFPILIFKKNSENAIHKIIDLDFMFGFRISTFPLIVKKIQSMKKMLLLLNNEKSIPESNAGKFENTLHQNITQRHFLTQMKVNKISMSSDIETRKMKRVVSYQNVINNVSYENIKGHQTPTDRNYFTPQPKINSSTFTTKNRKEHFPVNKQIWRNPLSTNGVLKVQGFQNKKIFRQQGIIGLPLMKFPMNVPGSESSDGKKYSFHINDEKLHYQDKGEIKKDIEEIKKIMIGTKESIQSMGLRASGQENAKPNLDINRISDLVYQNIERSIRMERERRGM